MQHLLRVRVRYPLVRGYLRLRCEPSWERELAPVAVSADGTCFEFEVRTSRPFVYAKPVLHLDGAVHWSRAENALLLSSEPEQELFPWFFEERACVACSAHRLVDENGDEHELRVHLPPGYEENTLRRYPAIYLQDAQNLFFAGESFAGHHWRIPETLEVLREMNAIEPVIAIGIYPRQREAQYTQPGYESYGRFLAETLKPWVDERWRTKREPEHNAVMGSSLGGVVSFHTAWRHPESFGLAGCLSSTFTWRDDFAERVVLEAKPPIRLYLDSGWPGDNYEVTREMRDLLVRRGFKTGADLLYLAYPQAQHDERAWAERVHVPLQFFFGHRPQLEREARPA
ncbi:MAG: alpha/beta hydrolase [Planctomycetes bacterium]|nr:alpha/beta hydrolase [Planctomycetota bacterium]